MAFDPNIVRVNRVPYSRTSLAHIMAASPQKGIRSVSFKDTREVELVYGSQQDGVPLGMTAGVYKVEDVSITMLPDSAFSFLQTLQLLGLGSYGDAQWPYLMQYYEPTVTSGDIPSLPQQTLISGCRIVSVGEKMEEGGGPLVTELSVKALFIIRTYSGVPLNLWSGLRQYLG